VRLYSRTCAKLESVDAATVRTRSWRFCCFKHRRAFDQVSDRVISSASPTATTDPLQQILPSYYFFNPPIAGALSVNVQVMNTRLFQMLNLLMEVQPLADRGMILVSAQSCLGHRAPGVSIRVNPADDLTTPFCVESGVPNPSLTGTNADGFGGLSNVPAGNVMVSGEILASGRTYGDVSLFVKPDSLTVTPVVAVGK
jgi:hypothetical protein